MTLIFSKVEAEITDDLISNFSIGFDFDAMLRKVCEDAGVFIVMDESLAVENENCNADQEKKKYKLKGLWMAMEKAYRHLVTTLDLYGSQLVENVPANLDIKNSDVADILDHPIPDGGDENEVEKEKVEAGNCSNHREKKVARSVLEEYKNKKTRRPRKSAVQSRKLINSIAHNDDMIEECDVSDLIEDNDEERKSLDCHVDSNDSAGKENDSKVFQEDETVEGKSVDERLPNVENTNKLSIRKRGRPKKYDDGIAEFPCSQCSFVAQRKYKLQSHIREVHLSKPTTCTICEKVFPNRRYMMRHKVSHGEPQHCCDVCGKMYKIKKAMVEHRKTHSSTYKKPSFKCDECPKSFCNQYVLDCHVRDIHQGLKKYYLCSVCGKSFTTKHSLAEHSNAHIGLKPYACEICGKTFSYESALRDHKFSHEDSKKFWCKYCQKSFCQRSGLKMHMRTHRLHKMFTCAECGRGFTQKQALQRHERVHKGEKPFICKHCGKFFTDASIIRRHLILVHKIEKSAKVWREDIVCTIVANPEYHVQNITEDDKLLTIEKEKEEVLRNVGLQNRPRSKKGPSRSFQRVYPRKVVVLDDKDNVISPSEVSVSSEMSTSDMTSSKTDSSAIQSTNSALRLKPLNSQSLLCAPLIGASDGVELDSQILNHRYIDQNQWETLTSQLNKATSTTHLEHIILEHPNQSEAGRNQDQANDLQKIIKCENVQTNSNPQQVEHLAIHSPRYSPVSFNHPLSLSNNSKSLENQFETLTAQLANTTGQYYDIRGTCHSAVPLSSMYYYSHLASQLGINISSDISYINTASSSSTHMAHSCVLQTSMDVQQVSSSSLIIQKPAQETDYDSPPQHSHSDANAISSSSLVANSANISSYVHNIPALLNSNPDQEQKGDAENSNIPPTNDTTATIIINPELSCVTQANNPGHTSPS